MDNIRLTIATRMTFIKEPGLCIPITEYFALEYVISCFNWNGLNGSLYFHIKFMFVSADIILHVLSFDCWQLI